MAKHKDVTLVSHSETDRAQTQTQEVEQRQCHDSVLPIQTSFPNQERFF